MSTAHSKPFYKRPLLWVLAAVVIVLAIAIGSSGSGPVTAAGDPQTPGSSSVGPSQPNNPLSDDSWTVGDVVPHKDEFMTTVTARILNGAPEERSAFFTMSVFDANGALLGSLSGAANNVGPSETATVELLATDDIAGDPAGWSYELQADW